ncbi:MAG: tetratricopeptide repeat protein [Calditrichaeota bacterium]|nr:tetratricopeptide repeat protein [Calditrichota bacterium]
MKDSAQLKNEMNQHYSSRLISFFFIATTILLIPFIYLQDKFDPVLLIRFIALSTTLLIMLTVLFFQRHTLHQLVSDYSFVQRLIFIVSAGYLIFSAISLIRCVNLSEGIFELSWIFISTLLLVVATKVLGDNEDTFPSLAKSLTLVVIVLCVIGICQYYYCGFNFLPGSCEPYATMTHRNLFSSFLFLSIPFVLFNLFDATSGNQKSREVGPVIWAVASLLAIVLIAYNVMIATSRAVWVGLIVSTIATSIALWLLSCRRKLVKSHSSTNAKNLIAAIFLFLIVAAGALLTSDIEIRTTDNLRFPLWSNTLSMISDSNLFGVGVGNWKIAFPAYGLGDMPIEIESGLTHCLRPHNDFLFVLAESGISGFLCYVLIFIFVISYIIRILLKSRDKHDQIFGLLMLFGIVGYLVIGFFSYPKERIAHTILVTLMIASVLSRYHRLFPIKKRWKSIPYSLWMIPLIALTSMSTWIGYSRLIAETQTKKALIARSNQDWEGVISGIDLAISPFYQIDPTTTPLQWYRGVAHFSKDNIDEALADFLKAHELHPNHIHVLNNLASCYEILSDHSKAIEFYTRALDISPRFEETLINLSAVYYNTKQYKRAYEVIQRCDPKSENPRVTAYLNVIEEHLR